MPSPLRPISMERCVWIAPSLFAGNRRSDRPCSEDFWQCLVCFVDLGERRSYPTQEFNRFGPHNVEWDERYPSAGARRTNPIKDRLVMRTAEGPFPMETTYEWDSIAAGKTRMRLRNRGAPSGFGSVVAPFMALAMKKANAKDLLLLKTILEG